MKRNLKALGLALIAALAMSAVAASAAQAITQGQFTADAYPATMTGHQEPAGPNLETNYFEFTPGRKLTCKEVTYEATLSQSSTALTVTPHFTGCENEGGLGTTMKLNGCHYLFTAGTVTNAVDTHGSTHLVCPVGKSIEMIVGGGICVVDVPAQSPKGGVTFTNLGGSTFTVHIDHTGTIKYTDTDNSFFCPFSGSGTFENGSFRSDVLFHCYKDLGNHTGETEAGVTKTTYTHGSATNCDVA